MVESKLSTQNHGPLPCRKITALRMSQMSAHSNHNRIKNNFLDKHENFSRKRTTLSSHDSIFFQNARKREEQLPRTVLTNVNDTVKSKFYTIISCKNLYTFIARGFGG